MTLSVRYFSGSGTGLVPSSNSYFTPYQASGGPPDAAIVFGRIYTATEVATIGTPKFSIGFYSSGSERQACAAVNALDNQATSSLVNIISNNSVCYGPSMGSAYNGYLVASPSTNSLDFEIESVTDTSSQFIAYVNGLYLNGISNSYAGGVTITSGATQSVTGIGFKPDAIFFAASSDGTTAFNTRSQSSINLCFGVAKRDLYDNITNNLFRYTDEHDVTTMNTSAVHSSTTASILGIAVTSMDSGGFTFSKTDTSNQKFVYLAIKFNDPRDMDVGYGLVPTSASTVKYDTTYTSVAGFLSIHNGYSSSGAYTVTGASGATGMVVAVAGNGGDDTNVIMSVDDAATSNTIGSSGSNNITLKDSTWTTAEYVGNPSSYSTDGFSINWSDAAPSDMYFFYVVFGDWNGVGDKVVPIGGYSATGSVGTLGTARSLPLSVEPATAEVGSLSKVASIALSGYEAIGQRVRRLAITSTGSKKLSQLSQWIRPRSKT